MLRFAEPKEYANAKRAEKRVEELEADTDRQEKFWADKYLAMNKRIQELEAALREADGILQYNLGDADPHVRSACDLMWIGLQGGQDESLR